MKRDNKLKVKVALAIAIALLFFSCLQSAAACETCDSSSKCTECSNCLDCTCESCNLIGSTGKENSLSISQISNDSTLSLGDGIHRDFVKVSIDKDITIKGNGLNDSIIYIDSDDVAFHVLGGNTLKLYNLTIISNFIYSDDEIANYTSLINLFNGSISGSGTVVFENCKFINNKQTDVVVTVNASSIYSSNRATFTAFVTDSNGNNVDGDVAFYINNQFSGRVGLVNGVATYGLNVLNGNYTVHVSYIGNENTNTNINTNTNLKISQNQISFTVASLIQALSVSLPTTGTIYYVSPTGLDTNTGTFDAPKQTIGAAYSAGNLAGQNVFSIIVQQGTYSGTGNQALSIARNVTIIGNDTSGTVTITPGSNIFATVSAGTASAWRNVNFYNMNLTGGTGTSSGYITIGSYCVVNVDSVEFKSITSGKTIRSTGGNVNLTVNNSQFINITGSGSGITIELTGGSTSGAGTGRLVVNNSVFVNVTGSGVGAIIRNLASYGPIEIYNSSFTNAKQNTATHGGIFCTGGNYFVVADTNFTNVTGANDGGVLYSHAADVHNFTNVIFTDCTSSGRGGAITTSTSTILNIKNCTFNNNVAGTNGGAIVASGGTFNIMDSRFNNNVAGTTGGAIDTSSTVNINNTNFTNNNATQRGGAISTSGGTTNVNNSIFRANFVSGNGAYGGALAATTGTINNYNSEFVNNSARNTTDTASYGGAAGVNGANAVINLINCTVHGNWAVYGGAFGAGASGGRINVINNTAIYNNHALRYGGVAGLSSAGTIIIENSVIYNNSADAYGGAFGANGGTINVTNSEINNNNAGDFGGAVGVNGTAGVINILDSFMLDNIAVNFGGAVGATGGTVNVRSSTLKRNRANGTTGYGGAIGLTTGNINVYDSNFINNSAVTYGGAVGVPTSGNFYANNSNFTDNVAGTYGGAIGSAAGVNITYCIFTNNRAGTFGGGVAAMAGTTVANSILSCQFEYNYAGDLGYGVYAANRLTANYNRFFNNTDADGNFNQTIWTNTAQSSNVNIDYNWWGENNHLAVGNLPNNYVVIDLDTVNYGLYNGSAHYTYTIQLNTTDSNFNVSRLPPFFGEARFTVPSYNTSFSAHLNGTIVSVAFIAEAYHQGYFRVDNEYIDFNVTTNSSPTVNLTVNLGTASGKYKDNVTLTANYTDNGGFAVAGLVVDFYVAGQYIGTNTTTANGIVYHSYTVASAGNLNYTVEYNGSNKNYNPVNGSTILNFQRLDTYIVVNNVVYGNSTVPVRLNATIYDEWNETVGNLTLDFYGISGGYYTYAVSDSSGEALAYYAFPVTGNYTWYAVFEGNGNYTSSNSSTTSIGKAEISPIVNLTINNYSNVTSAVNFGDYVTYTITVTNHGPDIATNVLVLDSLNSSLILQSVTATFGTFNNITGLWSIANISVNSTVTLTIVVRVNGTGNISNLANITSVDQPNLGVYSSSALISVSNAVNLSIVKSSNTTNAGYGDLVTYIINVTNYGPNIANDVFVVDELDYRLVFINSSTTIGTYNNVTGLWSIPSLAIGESGILTMVVRINGTGNISNLANITNVTEFDLGNGTNTSNIDVTVPSTVNLTISKTSNVTGTVAVGDLVTYTITVTNHGPDNATGVNVTDKLVSSLLLLNAAANIGTYDSNAGVWTIGNLAFGETARLYINVSIIGTGNIVNTASVSVNEVNLGNNSTSGVTLTVPSTVNLTISKTSNASANVGFGDEITYTIAVGNLGPDNATGVVVSDVLDPRLVFVNANAVNGNYSINGNLLTWNIDNLNIGSIATLNITVRINGTGNIVNIANVIVNQENIGDNNTNGSSNGTNFTVASTVNLTIVKSSNASSNANYLDLVTYTINVTNHGPDNATGLFIFDELDDRLVLLSASANIGTYNNISSLWTIENLISGESAILTMVVRINGTGNIANIANIATLDEVNLGNNSTNSSVNITVPSTVNLTVSKTSNVTGIVAVGDLVTYTVTVTNHGPDNATGVNVTDKLVSSLLLVNAATTIGNYNNNTGVWTIGNLAFGETATMYINVSIIGTGNIVNTASVSVNEVNIGNSSTNSTVTLTVPSSVNITISKISNASANVLYNDMISYTITVHNYGPDNATGVYVIDEIDYRLAYLSHIASSGNYTVANGVWIIENLNVGSSATLTINVRINGTGNIVNIANITVNQDNIGENTTDGNSNGTNFTVPSTVNLTIVKSTNGSTNASYGDIVTYTINVTNHGPDNATGVFVIDEIDYRLAVLDVIVNIGSYNTLTGLWDIGTISASESAILIITVRINGTGNIANVANLTAFNEDVNLNETNSSTVDITVPKTVNLTISKTSNVTGMDVGVGDLVTYIINVTNLGPDNATGVNVTDILSNRLLFLGSSSNIGSYNNNTGLWTIGNLNLGETATLYINVSVIGTGNIVNIANLSVNEVNLGNDSTNSSTSFSINSTVNLTISKSSNASLTVSYNDIIVYTIVVKNNGPDNATGVLVIDELDHRLAYISHSPSLGTYNVVNGQWIIGDLNAGSTATLTITVRVNGTGNIVNIANLSVDQNNIGENGTDGSSNSTNFTIASTVNLTIVKTSNASVNASYGDIVTYTINVTNFGPDNATGVFVRDELDSRLILLAASWNMGNYNNLTGVWNIPTIVAGESAILTLTVRLNGTGHIVNIANITAFAEEVNLNETNTSTVDITVPLTANVTVTKFSNITGNVTVGTTVLYTIRVTNNGPDNATGVIVTDVLDSRLSFISASSSSYNPVTGLWSIGNLNVGETLELNITVSVSGTGEIVNVANVSINEVNIGNNSTNGNNSTVNVPASVNISISKNSNVTTAIVGDFLSYTIMVVNNGPDNATGLVIIDVLDSRLTYLSASLSSYNVANGHWTIGNLAINQSMTLTINVRVNGTGNIPNVALVTVNQENIGSENASSIPLGADHIPTFISVENITQNATMPFTINGNLTSANGWTVNGFVNITINGTVYYVQVTNGKFSLTLNYDVYGLYDNLIVEYFGDAAFAPSNTNGWLNILPLATTTTVDTATALIFNYPTNITGHLLDQFARPVVGGTITFIVDGIIVGANITNAQGIAIYSFTPGPNPATYIIEAVYGGNSTYLGSNDVISLQSRDMGTQIIIPEITTKPYRNSEIPITLLNEFGTPIPGEIIRVIIDGVEHNLTTNVNGIAYLYHSPVDANPLSIEAEFIGNPLLRRSEEIGILNVEKLLTTIALENIVVTTIDETSFTATLKDEDGALLANVEVDIYIDGEYLGSFETDSYGRIYVTGEPLAKGSYTITAAFPGLGNVWAETSSESSLTVRPLKTTVTVSTIQNPNETSTFIAKLYDEFNKPLANKIVLFFLDGVFIGLAETDSNGVARLNYSFTPEGSIVAEFLGDSIYRESLDNRPFDALLLNNKTNTNTNTSTKTNSTIGKNTSNDKNSTTNGIGFDSIVESETKDISDIASDKGNNKSIPSLTMLKSGNPIAMVLICLLAILLIGFRRKRKN
ncbi:MAG: hypothetical protein FWH29_02750 [Methanobrevibacter sp.]|nr:hypothetical protein [Methanobrevibacter sp.]